MTTAQHLAEAATATCRHKADINEDRDARSGEHKAHVHGQRSDGKSTRDRQPASAQD